MSKGLLAWALGWHGMGYVPSLVTSLVMTWGVFSLHPNSSSRKRASYPRLLHWAWRGWESRAWCQADAQQMEAGVVHLQGRQKVAVVWLFGSRVQYPERGLLDILKWTRSAECSAWSNANTFNWPWIWRREEPGFGFQLRPCTRCDLRKAPLAATRLLVTFPMQSRRVWWGLKGTLKNPA